MLLTREEMRQDKSFGLLTDAILERDQPRTTDLFFQMVKRQGRSVGEALSVVTAAEAPFVQVPNHINVRDGQITLINNDHTILGLRASHDLAPFVPEEYRLLPLLQSVWYIPAGLDLPDAVPSREIPAAAAAAERLVYRRRARHLEPAACQISRPLCDDEGHPCAAARLWAGRVA